MNWIYEIIVGHKRMIMNQMIYHLKKKEIHQCECGNASDQGNQVQTKTKREFIPTIMIRQGK